MNKKLSKVKYLPNKFQVIEKGDHVIFSVSVKAIIIVYLNYWKVELQEPYYSYVDASKKKEELDNK